MNDLVQKVKNAGIVGAGGGGFPTHIKINTKAEYVIANGAECEPLIQSDVKLLESNSAKILEGLDLVVKNTGAKKGFIAIKGKHKKAINSIKKYINNYPNIELKIIKDIYPAGDEFLLVYEILNRIVPERGIPIEVGVIVNNVGTLYNIALANQNIPVTSRFVTVTGEVNDPCVLEVPIGTSFQDLINFCKGSTLNNFTILHNGPMMGCLDGTHVLKTTSGIVLLPNNHKVIVNKLISSSNRLKTAQSVCDQCIYCTMICSRGLLGHNLEPNKIVRAVNAYQDTDAEIIKSAMLCSECGLCAVYCDMGISPAAINKEIKKEFIKLNKVPPKPPNRKYTPHPFREYRLVPTKRLISRLDLTKYDINLPLKLQPLKVNEVKIFLKQHAGVPALSIVKVGDNVKKGELIAQIPEGKMGACYHASIDGKVVEVTDNYIVIKN